MPAAPRRNQALFLLCMAVLLALAACQQQPADSAMIVTLVVDGRERVITETLPLTVAEVLRREEVELGSLDEVNPPQFTQIVDGMRITVARVREDRQCDESEVPYQSRTILNEALAPGESRLAQPGQSGVEQVCYRVTIRDGVAQDPVPVSRVQLAEPQDEIIYLGPSGELDPVPVSGTLAYLSNNNAWVMRGSSTSKRMLTQSTDADGRVFAWSPDGRSLLYTRSESNADNTLFNRLWLMPDTTIEGAPVALLPENVLAADWVPNQVNTVSYSTGEVSDVAPGWRANNDLFVMTIDPASGTALGVEPIVPASAFGLYNWWGTTFRWSPGGSDLAWVRADSMGLVDLQTGEFRTLLSYPVFETRQSWSWRATVSFSSDESLILTTIHGAPIGNEPPETSPAFHVTVAAADGSFSAEVAQNTGIWSMPAYSPVIADPETGATTGYIAYLRARDLSNSISQSAEYDLVLADRDGSNARVLFPEAGRTGLNGSASITWSPDGTQLAFIYQGDLWLIDIASAAAHQLTLDGSASQPVWTR